MYSRKFIATLVYYAVGVLVYAILNNKFTVQAIIVEFKEFVVEQED